MMKYAVMTFMYNDWVNSDKGSHEELIDILAESGADGIESFCNHFMGNDALVRLYQKRMNDTGLAMPVMDLLANLAAPAGPQREEAYENMRRGIDLCESFNAEIVHLAGCRSVPGVAPETGRKLIAEGLMYFIDDVEKRGMTLAFEDFDPAPDLICSSEDCLDIIRQTQNRVKFVFDTGNFEASGEHAEDNFAKFIEHTCHFHFKDFQPDDGPKGYRGTHFGKGMIKNQEIARMIKQSGYSGWVALESYLQGENGPRETIPAELNVLKSLFE